MKKFSILLSALAISLSAAAGQQNYTYTDLIFATYPQLGYSATQTFSAKYNPTAFCPSIGLGYSF